MNKVYINGKEYSPEEAKISVYDRGFLFGDGIYEVTRSYGNVLFALEDHIQRLYYSADRLGIHIPFSQQAFIQEIYSFYNNNFEKDAYIRIQLSRGDCRKEQISLFPENHGIANVVMYLHTLKLPAEKIYTEGSHLYCGDIIRNSKKATDPNIKSGNYLNNIMALLHVDKSVFDDSFFLNAQGYVTEGTTFNLYMVKDGVIYTSPDESDILLGITRKIIIREASKNYKFVREHFKYEDLMRADEVFATSSTKEVFPITQVNQSKIGNGKVGPVSQNLKKIYNAYIDQYIQWAQVHHPLRK